jgi:AcrR family transcriptional regulator
MEVDKIKESIKKAAQDLFRKYGYHKTSVNEIAKRAKIAKATIYKYFESKELLSAGYPDGIYSAKCSRNHS